MKLVSVESLILYILIAIAATEIYKFWIKSTTKQGKSKSLNLYSRKQIKLLENKAEKSLEFSKYKSITDQGAEERANQKLIERRAAISKKISTLMRNRQLSRKDILEIKNILHVRKSKKYNNDLHAIYSQLKYNASDLSLLQVDRYLQRRKFIA